ncbi:MAG: DNA methyltransferase [Candidatus Aminicenantaceae bacterium]
MNDVSDSISQFYDDIKHRKDLIFRETPRSEINEIVHCYHSYPAKFIPQLARSLIKEFTEENDIIWDPFCGSATLNVEAIRNCRNSIGSDVNPISILISKAKTTPLDTEILSKYKSKLFELIKTNNIRDVEYYLNYGILNGNFNELKEWFPDSHLLELGHILSSIKNISGYKNIYRNFSRCCLSSIIKKTSFWLDSSIKLQKDPDKEPKSPIHCFEKHFSKMEKANEMFYQETKDINSRATLILHNAKHILPKEHRNNIDHIITSPPYLVSYEYSDLFRLSTYFFYYQENYMKLKTSFIGSKLNKKIIGGLKNEILKLSSINFDKENISGWKKSILNYYLEMALFIRNAKKHLKKDGNFIMIVGDTTMRSVYIPNAFILSEIAEHFGFSLKEKFKREIVGKYLPQCRDKVTGKFTSKDDPNKKEVHKEEYILVFERG